MMMVMVMMMVAMMMVTMAMTTMMKKSIGRAAWACLKVACWVSYCTHSYFPYPLNSNSYEDDNDDLDEVPIISLTLSYYEDDYANIIILNDMMVTKKVNTLNKKVNTFNPQ